jgi:hypothetical protein
MTTNVMVTLYGTVHQINTTADHLVCAMHDQCVKKQDSGGKGGSVASPECTATPKQNSARNMEYGFVGI